MRQNPFLFRRLRYIRFVSEFASLAKQFPFCGKLLSSDLCYRRQASFFSRTAGERIGVSPLRRPFIFLAIRTSPFPASASGHAADGPLPYRRHAFFSSTPFNRGADPLAWSHNTLPFKSTPPFFLSSGSTPLAWGSFANAFLLDTPYTIGISDVPTN